MELLLSNKFKEFLKYRYAEVEVLEGQTYAGKTTVGAIKFVLKCLASKRKQHGICGLDIGTVEKNIINSDLGLTTFFGSDLIYYPNGCGEEKLSHIRVKCTKGDKIIYVFGYNDTTKWKKALGGQLGCLFIDEANISDIDFIREAMMRADYKMLTLNPDNPELEIYSEYINHTRPLEKYVTDVPQEMLSQLYSQKEYKNWIHWYFRMDDNLSLTKEKKSMIIQSVPVGSKLYKNKILGLRGRSEGLVYPKFDRLRNVIPIEKFTWLPNETCYRVLAGLDTGVNIDATAMPIVLLTTAGRMLVLPSMYYDHKKGDNTASGQANICENWLNYWLNKMGCYDPVNTLIVGDSAGITQDVIGEINKRTQYRAVKVPKKDVLQDYQRLNGIIEKDNYFYILNAGYIDPITFEKKTDTDMLIVELENKVWDKKTNKPEDGEDHCIDAMKYLTYYIYYGGVI